MNLLKLKRSVTGRIATCLTVVMILVMSLLDSLVYRPMEAYAAAVALPVDVGAYASAVVDVARSIGMTFNDKVRAFTFAVDFIGFVEERRKEIVAEYEAEKNPEVLARTTIHTYKGREFSGGSRSFAVSNQDILDTAEKIDSLKEVLEVAEEGVRIPESFFNAVRLYLGTNLNISALDGTAPRSTITITTDQYFHSFPSLPLSFQESNGLVKYWSSGPVWCHAYSRSSVSNKVAYYCKAGTVLHKSFYQSSTGTWIERTYTAPAAGEGNYSGYVSFNTDLDGSKVLYPEIYASTQYSVGLKDIVGERYCNFVLPARGDLSDATIMIDVAYADNPSLELGFDLTDGIAWKGTADLGATLNNQKAAAGTDEYAAKVFTTAGSVVVPTDPAIPSESETSGSGTGEPDITLSGILGWLEKIYNGVIALPGNIASKFSSALAGLGEAVESIPAALSGIGEKVSAIPDAIGKELTKLGDWIQTIPGVLADIKDAVLAVPKDIAASIAAFFTIDTVRVENSYNDMSNALKAKLSALNQIIDIFDQTNYTFSETPPVFKMRTPDALLYAVKSDEIVIMDLTQFADLFRWCRTLLSALLWVAFGKWVIDQFDVQFHVG